MTPTDDHPTRDDLDAISSRLEAERPVPAAAFRGDLRRHLLAGRQAGATAPRRLKLLVAAYGGSGLTLLAVAAIGVAGAGPLAT